VGGEVCSELRPRVRAVNAVIDPAGERFAALNRTLRGKGRGVTGSGSRLGVGVASLLIWLVLVLVFSLGVARKSGGAGNWKRADQGRPGGVPAGWREGGGSAAAKTFEVKRASDNVVVSSGALGPASADADSGDCVSASAC
jgi:hypothetical protein